MARRAVELASATPLLWARPCAEPDWLAAKRGPRKPAKKAGLAFERALGLVLTRTIAAAPQLGASLSHGQWLTFGTLARTSWCQPDFLLFSREEVLIIECKLSFIPEGLEQLQRYAPVVEAAFGRRAVLGLACKNLRPSAGGHPIVDSLSGLWNNARWARASAGGTPLEAIPVLHWLGRGEL